MLGMPRLTLLAGISLLAACGREPSVAPPASPVGPAPSALGSAPPAASAPARADAAPKTAPTLALFAEGWGLDVGDVRGATVLYDHYVIGMGRVQGDQVEYLPPHSLPREVGYRVGGVFGAWPAHLWARMNYPTGGERLHRWSGSDWGSGYHGGISVTYENYWQAQFCAGTEAGTLALLRGSSEARIVPVGPDNLNWEHPAHRVVDHRLEARAVRTNDQGDAVVAGLLGSRLAAEYWAAGAGQGVLQELPEIPRAASDQKVEVALCAGPSRRMYVVRDTSVPSEPVGRWPQRKIHVIGSIEGQWKLLGEMPGRLSEVIRFVACTVSADDALWVAFASRGKGAVSQLLRLGPEGQWATIAVPVLSPLDTLPRFEQSGPQHSWRLVSVPITGRQDFEITGLHASSSGELWVVGQRTIGGFARQVTGVPYTSYVRTAVLRSGSPRAGGSLRWEETVGSVLDAAPVPLGPSGRSASPPLPAPKPSAAPSASRAAPPASAAPPPPAPPPPPLRASKPLVAATPKCQSVFVALYTVQPATPADYDFPQTRSALRGKTEFAGVNFVEVNLNRRRMFGALTQSYELGQRLAEFLRAKVAGSAPQLLCGDPAILRSVPMVLDH